MQISRRLFSTTALAVPFLAVAGCAGAGALTSAQVLADASGIVNQLSALVPNIAIAAPTVLTAAVATQAEKALALAKGLLAGLTANVPAAAGASTLLTVE